MYMRSCIPKKISCFVWVQLSASQLYQAYCMLEGLTVCALNNAIDATLHLIRFTEYSWN